MQALFGWLFYPLGLGLAALILGLGVLAMRWRRSGWSLIALAVVWLWLWSTPALSDFLRGGLERQYPSMAAEQVPSADVIVVLGGAFSHDPSWIYPDVNAHADRYWHAARLFHAGKSSKIMVSGGRSPGLGPGLTEAAAGALFLRNLGVPGEAVLLEDRALTTRQNAVYVSRLLEAHDVESFLLVTSALHMRRSEAAFRALGLDPIPVATDFEIRPHRNRGWRRWRPSANALAGNTRAWHEHVGYWTYRRRGWID
ncbi:MAG: YdcF family protein [Wenzhouxiangella sp.]